MGEGAFAGTRGNDKVAPIPDLPALDPVRGGSTRCGPSPRPAHTSIQPFHEPNAAGCNYDVGHEDNDRPRVAWRRKDKCGFARDAEQSCAGRYSIGR